ncbi:histone deacetylation protein Rxt3-domain-containing protein [Mycotypha africana]|uniref:histone deacetylation protein Rxt3-domain-containing protein n=1 Tax=Mycotypha africana TaxID=64632 RepID=UPI0023019D20|nr:histone deacetylation protein Rxt3-domain-containing protein [Mycotypha africana]KAI8969136.1 histone deacetylation protein Rxt3-domain-containing protein [Mycotypha africana]
MNLMGNAFSNMIDQAAMMLGRNKSFGSEGGKVPPQQHHQPYYTNSSLKANNLTHFYSSPQQQQQQPHSVNHQSLLSIPLQPQQRPPAQKDVKPTLKVNNDQVWKSIEGTKESFLGFYLYSPQFLLPNLERNVNGIIEIRVPAKYLTYGNVKVKKRALWGTEIYTDDSDIVAMAIHSGKFEPQFIESTLDTEDPFVLAVSGKYKESCKAAKKLALRGKKYINRNNRLFPDFDLKVTVRVLPTLQHYASSVRHKIKSREWRKHDGMSLFVTKVEKIKRGEAQLRGRIGLKSNHHHKSPRKQLFECDDCKKVQPEEKTNIASSMTSIPDSVGSIVRYRRTEKGRVKKPPRVLRVSQIKH